MFHVSKLEHKTSPAPFEVVHIEFEQDLTQPTITIIPTTETLKLLLLLFGLTMVFAKCLHYKTSSDV